MKPQKAASIDSIMREWRQTKSHQDNIDPFLVKAMTAFKKLYHENVELRKKLPKYK